MMVRERGETARFKRSSFWRAKQVSSNISNAYHDSASERAMMLILKTSLFTIVAPGTVTFLVPYFILTSRIKLPSIELGAFRFSGLLAISLGAAIYLWCAWNFISKGKGTPAPWDPPTRLVAADLYRVVRNPMYLGISTVVLGEAIFFESIALLIYAALLPLGFHLRVVYYEEPALKNMFGDSYNRYCEEVKRWMPNGKR